MVEVVTDPFVEALEKVEAQYNLREKWNFGMRQTFLNDIKREVESVNKKFRLRGKGIAIDIQDNMTERLKHGPYTKEKPGAKEKYVSPFEPTDTATRRSKFEYTKGKTLPHLQYKGTIFSDDKAIDKLAKNVVPILDGNDLRYVKVSYDDVGILYGSKKYTLDEVINGLSLAKSVDSAASKIALLQIKASLRKMAVDMVPAGSKPAAIEAIVEELYDFKKRDLVKGILPIPQYSRNFITDEQNKFREINGLPKLVATTSVGVVDPLDDLSKSIE